MNIKLNLIITLFLISNAIYAQVSIHKIESKNLPKQIKYAGNIVNSVKWTDAQGEHFVITTKTDEYPSKIKGSEDLINAELYAYYYVLKNDNTKLLWKIFDFNKACGFDLYLKFIDNSFQVTDLDKNGVAEVWIMYENQCTSDVSPAPTKIIMYEGIKKYAIRGLNRIKMSENEFIGGQYTLDNNFKNGNSLFRKFGIELWETHKNKTW